MLGRLFLLFSLTTAVELWILVQLGRLMGMGATLALIILTGFVGAWLTKREGLRTLARVRTDLAEGRLPGDALLDGLCILVAGAFLVTPGVLTDAVGFSLLIPPMRTPIKAGIRRAFERAIREGRANANFTYVRMGPDGVASVRTATAGRSDAPPVDRQPAVDLLRPRNDRRFRSGDVIDVTPD